MGESPGKDRVNDPHYLLKNSLTAFVIIAIGLYGISQEKYIEVAAGGLMLFGVMGIVYFVGWLRRPK